MGHPRGLLALSMTEFWERFSLLWHAGNSDLLHVLRGGEGRLGF